MTDTPTTTKAGGGYDDGSLGGTSSRLSRPRNGLGTAALGFGLVAVFCGIIPFAAVLAVPLGLVGLLLGLLGWRRAVRGRATNKSAAISGVALSVTALVLAAVVVSILVSRSSSIVRPPEVTGVSGLSSSCAGKDYVDAQTTDVCATARTAVTVGGVSVNLLEAERWFSDNDADMCASFTVTKLGETDERIDLAFTLLTPAGDLERWDSSASGIAPDFLVSDSSTSDSVCFSGISGESGQYVLFYKPTSSEPDRAVWSFVV